MTAKEKAKELVYKYQCGYKNNDGFNYPFNNDFEDAKQCALIAVDELINNIKPIEINQLITSFKSGKDFNDNFNFMNNCITKNLINEKLYWKEVKQEIKLL